MSEKDRPSAAPAGQGPLRVSAAEAGVKLLRFLERALPDQGLSRLHKWIRSGQVRVNGGRAKAFDPLAEGDLVRLPPFARPCLPAEPPPGKSGPAAAPPLPDLGPGLTVAFVQDDYFLLNKPGGLPVQGGSGHQDSVAARLAGACAAWRHIPAPAHRLDRDTSGLLLAGRSQAARKRLHELLRAGGIGKDYLAWVRGLPALHGPCLLVDRLEIRKNPADGREYTACLPGGRTLEASSPEAGALLANFWRGAASGAADAPKASGSDTYEPERSGPETSGPETSGPETSGPETSGPETSGPETSGPEESRPSGLAGPTGAPDAIFAKTAQGGKSALCLALPVTVRERAGGGPFAQDPATLVLLRLFTGRKHQLRVQLAARNLPVLGDRRYGSGFPGAFPLLLHAWRLVLPRDLFPEKGAAPSIGNGLPEQGAAPGRDYRLEPPWPAPFAPDAAALEQALVVLAALRLLSKPEALW